MAPNFVEAQLQSVLDDLGPDDEVVVLDDASTDDTVRLVTGFTDPRIRVIASEVNVGHVPAFARALAEARGEVVMFSDQDDLWPAGRTAVLVSALERGDVAAGAYTVLGTQSGPPHPLHPGMDGRRWGNLLGLMLGRRSYFGSCMAVRRRLVPLLLPFPRSVEAHDHWFAVVGNVSGSVVHLRDTVTWRRLHDDNLTSPRRRGVFAVTRTRLRHVAMAWTALVRRIRTGVT